MNSQYSYPGEELAIFQQALNWKSYWGSLVAPYLRGEIAEVGAGVGGTTLTLLHDRMERWYCLEPDPTLAEQLRRNLESSPLRHKVETVVGTLADLPESQTFDAVLYIDVLEHIEDDRGEMIRAASRLRKGGALIVLSPAHQWLFSEFDTHVGHVRRYTTGTLKRASPPDLRIKFLRYLDAVGVTASLANRALLSRSLPTLSQILFWDRKMIPVSRVIDPLLGFRVGKSVLGVWIKP